MPYRRLDDGAGETLRVLDIDGYFLPTYDDLNAVTDHDALVRSLPNWKCRPDDVYICAYPKAGKTNVHCSIVGCIGTSKI